MGSFADSLFQLILGWTRGVIAAVWKAFSSPPTEEGITAWFGEHWIALALVLCGACVVTDLLVYFFRWRPDRVWNSFFQRLRHQRDSGREPVTSQNDTLRDEAVASVGDINTEGENTSVIRPRRRRAAYTDEQNAPAGYAARRVPETPPDRESAYGTPVYPPDWKGERQEHRDR